MDAMIARCATRPQPAISKSMVIFAPRPAARLRLICFPYAGGGASVYRSWARHLPACVEVVAVQPPGRESRIGEGLPATFELLANEIADTLCPLLDKPCLFFGHSMGGLLSFEVARRLLVKGGDAGLRKLLISGVAPPCRRNGKPPIHELPDEEFINEVRKLNGTSEEVFADPELRSLFLPTIRADFRLIERFRHVSGPALPLPFRVYGGEQDDIPMEDLLEWRAYCSSSFDLRILPGDHFFLHSFEDILMHWVRQDIQAVLDETSC